MRDNRNDRTIQRNYIQKWCFLVAEYEIVKAVAHLEDELLDEGDGSAGSPAWAALGGEQRGCAGPIL